MVLYSKTAVPDFLSKSKKWITVTCLDLEPSGMARSLAFLILPMSFQPEFQRDEHTHYPTTVTCSENRPKAGKTVDEPKRREKIRGIEGILADSVSVCV